MPRAACRGTQQGGETVHPDGDPRPVGRNGEEPAMNTVKEIYEKVACHYNRFG